ncbi:TetR/AcrR family transcriptional regulator [Microbacterium sp. EYE_5]|uniref:TetR/AcrR family transcriptional regulator n=1 Tax=unclassified Microbacterium TaxID=2609290 RepID=UPI002003BFB3|nr:MULTISPECIES: TetR family transcriptional regulator [unclassified Microbacterium]MCK6079038.1 TetR/AcrR family transcriptional regulator [Microbacterium sp. EYE_382]MCK6084308.1 TetR/AcrR family transcriptional regulator [Microbacterium sp. EYE_384]MCK6123463.1 TetR/AcrR family transcriptional regulator [Microbacterium sp. EYE_80]MCK6125072.1 TetR/AcrR family transcriptional regulator [Microbacterium sp. EYE_79]MCK6139992.1 TetR/AcrR family transcriptional regulator [Microbacterium sp. EYE_
MHPLAAVKPARLRAAEACCELYIRRNTTDLTIAEISSEIGISQRSFYRYFAIKAESIGPVFDWTTAAFDAAVESADQDADIRDVLQDGWRAMLGGDNADRTRRLFPLVFADAEMWSLFLRKVHDGERALTPILSARLGLDAESPRARAASAAVASATRIALEQMVTAGADAEAAFISLIDAFSGDLLRSR